MGTRQRFLLLVLAMTVVLALSGCGAKVEPTGIRGRVVSEEGAGIEGATVLLQPSGQAVTTDQDGAYAFGGLLAGEYKLSAAKSLFGPAQFQAQAEPEDTSASLLTVLVKEGEITVAPDIVLKPTSGIDRVVLQKVSPSPQESLAAGTEQDVSLSIEYSLQSRASATLIVMLAYVTSEGKQGVFAGGEQAIAGGQGTVTWSAPVTVPHGVRLSYIAQISSEDTLLAYTELVGPTVTGALRPQVPNLSAAPGDGGIHLSWNGGTVVNVESLTLERTELATGVVQAIPAFEDGRREYVDTDVREGANYYYTLKLTTLEGTVSQKTFSVTVPARGLSEYILDANVGDAVVDQGRGVIYGADLENPRLMVYSADTGAKETEIAVSSKVRRLAINADGSWLAAITSDGRSIDFIDLGAYKPYVMNVPDGGTAVAIAMHPNGRAYVAAYTKLKTLVLEVDVAAQSVIRQAELDQEYQTFLFWTNGYFYRPLAVSNDGSMLFVATTSQSAAVDLTTFTTTDFLDGTGTAVTVSPVADEVYIGPYVYTSSAPFVRTCTLPSTVLAIDSAGTALYTVAKLANGKALQVFRPGSYDVYNSAEEIIVANDNENIQLLNPVIEANKLYFIRGTYRLGVIDFSQR